MDEFDKKMKNKELGKSKLSRQIQQQFYFVGEFCGATRNQQPPKSCSTLFFITFIQ
jgi:hypothetical protein